jgi:hypothetical protein
MDKALGCLEHPKRAPFTLYRIYNTAFAPDSNSKKYTVRRLGQKRKERIVEGVLVDVQKRIIANFLPCEEQHQYNRAHTIPAEDIFHILTFDGDVSYGLFFT